MSDAISSPHPSRWSGMSALNFVLLVAVGAIILTSMHQVAPSPKQLAQGLPGMANLLDRMMPPNMEPAFLTRMAWRILETFQIALVGATIGIAISLPIGWLAAKQVTPIGRFGYLVKVFTSLLRTIPDLVWALLFVATVGLGAVAGTMTIVVDTIGFCGRFFAEAMGGFRQTTARSPLSCWRKQDIHSFCRHFAGHSTILNQHITFCARKGGSLFCSTWLGRCGRYWAGVESGL